MADYVDGAMTGQGVHKVNGEKYIGDFKDQVRHGLGILTYPVGVDGIGKTYIGQFDKGVKSGKGILKMTNGHTWDGKFKHDQVPLCGITMAVSRGCNL